MCTASSEGKSPSFQVTREMEETNPVGSAPVLWMGNQPFPAIAEGAMLQARRNACGFQRESWSGKQEVPVSSQHSSISRTSICVFHLSWCIEFSAKGNMDTVLTKEFRTHRRMRWILNHGDKAKNKSQQLSNNVSTFRNLWSKTAGNNTQCYLIR